MDKFKCTINLAQRSHNEDAMHRVMAVESMMLAVMTAKMKSMATVASVSVNLRQTTLRPKHTC
jgi:hypothetical protein